MDKVISDFMNQEYAQARAKIAVVLKTDPDNIDALFMKVNAKQIEIIDYESYSNDGYRFLRLVDSILTIMEKRVQSCPIHEKAKYLFYAGTVYGMKSLVLAKVGEWINAIKFSHKYVKTLEEAHLLDPAMIETRYGIGVVNYYLAENLKWIPFMGVKAKQGLEDIEVVARSDSPLSFMAKNSLSLIYIERADFQKADALVSSVLAEYPNNTIFLRIKARVALNKQDYGTAGQLSAKLISLSSKRNPVNWCDLMDGYQISVASLDAQGRYAECLKKIASALDLQLPDSANKIEYVRKHRDYITLKKDEILRKL
jgi:tetratricopeptide (TPR) repeat protein